MSMFFHPGQTSQSVVLFLQDSSSTTGAGLQSLAYNTSNLEAWYKVGATGALTQITLASLASDESAWTSGGFVKISDTNAAGGYRLDMPNAALALEDYVSLLVKGAANLADTWFRLECRPVPANIKKLNDSPEAAQAMQKLYDSSLPVVVDDSTFTPTESVFETDGSIAADDTLIGMGGTWYNASGSPANIGIYFITDSEGTTTNSNDKLKLTVETMPVPPNDGDVFIILGGRSK